jgi:hypothetical protein
MLSSKSSLATLLQGVLVGYLLVSVIYTTSYILASPLNYVLSYVSGSTIAPSPFGTGQTVVPRVDLVAHAYKVLESRQHPQPSLVEDSRGNSSWNLASSRDLLYWGLPDLNSSDTLLSDDSGVGDSAPIQEGTFLSKAFAQAIHPIHIIPFYYKATGPVDEDDVTITTLVTSNRYKVLRQLVERYQGTQAEPTTLFIDIFMNVQALSL